MLASCKAYKQDIMFKMDSDFSKEDLNVAVEYAERNYIIQKDDLLSIDVFTDKGERIIDPNNELTTNTQIGQQQENLTYLVQQDGMIKLPMIGKVQIDSLTLDQAEAMLEGMYDAYYKGSFVKLNYLNKRVVILGSIGGQIIPLLNENTSLVEVLATAGGVQFGGKVQNIKVIRGVLSAPEVFRINLSTISGMKESMLIMEPGDIIYIEPWRQPWLEATKDVVPLLSLLSSTLALILVLQNF